MQQSESLSSLGAALAEAQSKFPPVLKTKTAKIDKKAGGFYTYNYADLGDVLKTVGNTLKDNGLAVTQLPATIDGKHALATRLLHSSGEWIEETMLIPITSSDPQSLGSAITYARRYALCSVLGIAAEEDDDGAASTGHELDEAERRIEHSAAIRSFIDVCRDWIKVTKDDELHYTRDPAGLRELGTQLLDREPFTGWDDLTAAQLEYMSNHLDEWKADRDAR